MIYAQRASGGEHGSVTTRDEVADFMLDLCGYIGTNDLSGVSVLDPSAGDGVFIIAAIRRLFDSAQRFGFDFQQAVGNLTAVEIDTPKSRRLEKKISGCVKGMDLTNRAGRPRVINGDFLIKNLPAFDIIIGNPPYVRHENIPPAKREDYRSRFRCFRHRSDIYVAFFEKALEHLSETGQLCFICPDRWLKNRYGGNLRDRISERNGVPAIINLNDLDVFRESVNSYPMIILANTDAGLGSIEYFDMHDLSQLKSAVLRHARKGTSGDGIRKTVRKPDPGELWVFDGSGDSVATGTFSRIEEQGFRIGIGVATGADSVFIGKELPDTIERERLVPIVVSKDIVDGMINWSGNYVLNPFDEDGALVDLERHPMMKRYLLSNRERLCRRHVAKNSSGEKWYRTIDMLHVSLVMKPKLLLPDMKKDRTIAMDSGAYYPHHNLYYVVGNAIDDLKVLGAILMSDLSLNQLNSVGMHMRGGYTRWQAQSLRRLVIPPILKMPKSTRDRLAYLFDKKEIKEINAYLTAYTGRTKFPIIYR